MRLVGRLDAAAAVVRQRTGDRPPAVGVVLGSGLAGLADLLARPTAIPWSEIPHLARPSVPGHPGMLQIGEVGGCTVAMLLGRLHTYEGFSAEESVFPVRVLIRLGIRTLLVTNSAGGIREDLPAGGWMAIVDHLNLSGQTPLRGPEPLELGPRFPDLSRAYDLGLRDQLREAARVTGLPLYEGVYAMLPGPSYETPAEIRMLRTLGADAVGMSTVHEVLAAVHQGVRVAGLSCITNPAAGLGPSTLSHRDVTAVAQRAEDTLRPLLAGFLPAAAAI